MVGNHVWGKSNATNSSGRDDKLSRTGGSDGNYYAWITKDTGDQYINSTNISTAGHQNIKISYYYNLQGSFTPSNDFLFVEWKLNSGNTWNVIQKVTNLPGWNLATFDLPGAGNTVIDLRVRESGLDNNDFIFIDDINISGSLIANCGNNIIQNGEHCDDGNTNNSDLCSNTCTLTFCGDAIIQHPNGLVTAGPQNDGIEACDDGNLVNNDTCDNNCASTIQGACGNSIVNVGEQCDDGNTNNGDGCSSTCQVEVQQPVCGNNVLESGEQCDDGNTVSGDGCSNNCVLEICGDGITQLGLGEQCDDGNQNNNDACKNDCTNNICGDSFVETNVEQCDDGNTANGDGCSSTCQLEFQPVCGNGILEFSEQCDDGNTVSGDGCSINCVIEFCGDGIIQLGLSEECDDKNNNNGDGCNSACKREFCGDGIVQAGLGEQCDDANFNNHDACLNTCKNPTCGDGFLRTGIEQCDDGNNLNGDGCAGNCTFESKGTCISPVDIMLVIDRSGSMTAIEGGNTRLQNAKNASITFVNNVNFSKDKVGLDSFNETATLDRNLTSNKTLITNAINALKAGGATNIGDGIKLGRQELVAHGGPTKAMILLSDGAPNVMTLPNGSTRFCFVDPQSPTNCTIYASNQSNITKAAGIEIFTIGLGVNNFTESLLKEIATVPTNYFSAPNSTILTSIYLQIAAEICPCKGFDCSINNDQCNVGLCNLQTDQCEFNPKPVSTSCTEDSTNCTTQHCDGSGACVVNKTVQVPASEQCKSFYCDSVDGQVKVNLSQFPLSTPCSTDQNLCTKQHCNGQGNCVVNETTQVPASEQCKSFFCDPLDGQVKPNNFQLSTPCQADNDFCTIDHCNGQGNCVKLNDTSVPPPEQCKSFFCDPADGKIKSTPFQLSTPCEADGNLCTIDHCNGQGSCVQKSTVDCSFLNGECQEGLCNPQNGACGPSFINFPLSTFCETDDNDCTVQHCNGQGNCVINPQAEIPKECEGEVIKDSKVSQSLPTSNFGLGRYMLVNPKQGAIDNSYLRIDATPLLGKTVNSADLKVAVYQTGGNATGSAIQAFYCRGHDFVETTINWNNQPINSNCSLADSFVVPNEVVSGIPETIHVFDLLNETNFELSNGDGLYTIVLKSAEENKGITHNKKYVQYLTKEYPDAAFRPKLDVS